MKSTTSFVFMGGGKENNIIDSFRLLHNEIIESDNFMFGRNTNNRFMDDKIFFEDEELIVLVDGYILNFGDLTNSTSSSSRFLTIKNLYIKYGSRIPNELRGEFSLFIYDKTKKEFFIFTDQTSSKPLFYVKVRNMVFVSSQIYVLVEMLNKMAVKLSLNLFSSYQLLTFGYMIHDYTLFDEIKKISAGNYLHIYGNSSTIENYHNFSDESLTLDSKEKIIDEIYYRLKYATSMQLKKDDEYRTNHLITLSGGLDSRVVTYLAAELGYKVECLTFSESDYDDEKIAKRIADDLKYELIFYSLNNGLFLKNIEQIIKANNGIVFYAGAAHQFAAVKKLNLNNYGLLHTGQLGDALLGTYLSKPKLIGPSLDSGAYSRKLIPKITNDIDKIVKNYNSEQIYKLYNRGFNAILNGHFILSDEIECASPFLNVDFIEYSLKIPFHLKYDEKIYREMIVKKMPNAAKIPWERTHMLPKYSPKFQYLTKGIRFSYSFISGKKDYAISMNPFEYWYKKNDDLRKFTKKFFNENISVLDPYQELKNDCEILFNNGNFIEKSMVLTLLETSKLFL
ncbi:MAG: asparagine synthase-related protein [Ignavibacteriaceae bacterium]